MTTEQKAHCGFPGCTEPTSEDDECHGCGVPICGKHAEAPWGQHDPDDHVECSVCGEPGHFDGECPDEE